MRKDSFIDLIFDHTYLDEKFEVRCWEILRLMFIRLSHKRG